MYGSAEPMNFQPKFDSGRSISGDFLPKTQAPAPEPKRPDDRHTKSLILRLT